MLVKDPKKRLSAKQVLEHQWVVDNSRKNPGQTSQNFAKENITDEIIQNMKFQEYPSFKRLALSYMISILEHEETAYLKKGFNLLDTK